MKIYQPLPRSERGAILIVAMLLSAIIAISLGTYVNLCINSLKMADRTFYNNAAMNLVEMGVEEAMWSYTDDSITSTGWSTPVAWNTSTGNTAKTTFGPYNYSGNVTGSVKVYVTDRTGLGASPMIIARSIITLPRGAPIEKWIEITLSKRSKFALGLVAKNSIQFSGNNASVDSWNSDPDNDPSTAAIPYSGGVANDAGSIGSVDVSSTISVNNADIWGTAATGAPTTAAIGVGPNGRVGPYGTPGNTLDPGSVSTDFTANLEDVALPAGGLPTGAIGATVGVTGTTTVLRFGGTISANLEVYGDVTLILTAPAGTSAISQTGPRGIEIKPGATLKIYTAGDVQIAGNGVLNPNSQPSSFQLWGTSTSAVLQDIKIAGNGTLSGLCYAPNAALTINGNGDVCGSFVANTIKVTGNAAFHYDESLENFETDDPYGISKWRELTTAADRAAYSAMMSF